MNQYVEALDRCVNFGDILEVVRESVKETLGLWRAGLSLYLAELPLNVGAFHEVGSNIIVMNRLLLDIVAKAARSKRELNAYVYSILLHEYLHALGHIEEGEVRSLVYKVSNATFGKGHPATEMAVNGPLTYFPQVLVPGGRPGQGGFEVVRDFDRANQSYIM